MKGMAVGGLARAGLVAFAAGAALAAMAPIAAATPAVAGTRGTARAVQVVVVGIPGLRWDDVSPAATPTLWRLAETGAVGSLSVRAAVPVTCAADGWATLGAGNRARGPRRGEHCPASPPRVDPAVLGAVTRLNDREQYGAQVAALGATVRRSGGCVDTVGDQAPLATGGFAGGSGCALRVVQLPSVAKPRADAVRRADRDLGSLTLGLKPGTLLLVVGVSETDDDPPHLHVAIATGPGFAGGRQMISPTTRRQPFVQLIDVAPTALDALGLPVPSSMTGRPLYAMGSARPLASTVHTLVDLDRAAQEQRRLVPPFFAVLVVGQALLYLLAAAVLHRIRIGRSRGRVLVAARVGATAGAAAIVSTYLANLVPWWRAGHPLPVLVGAVVVATAAITGLAFLGPWRREVLGPPGAVALVTAAVLAADIVTGAHLQMSSLAGYSPLVAGRFVGFGNVAFAVFATGALLAAATLAGGRSRRTALAVVAVIGLAAVVVDGYPSWGDDFGGVLALVPAFAVLWMRFAGVAVTPRRVGIVVGLAVLVVAAFALADYARPASEQTHLGRFVGQVLHGGAWTVVHRKAQGNLALLTHSVLTLLVPLAVVLLTAVLLRPWGGLRHAFTASPALRHGLVATLVMGVVGFFTNDSGVAIPALAMTVAIPFAIAASAQALRRAGPSEPEPAPPVLP
jgi:hypothetical protein